MNRIVTGVIVLLTAFALVVVPCVSGFAQDLEMGDDVVAGKMTGDVLVVRPLSLGATLIGGTIFIVSLPFSALGGNTGSAFHYLLADPFKFTFSRPLGDL